MKTVRNMLYLVAGLLLGVVSSLSYADQVAYTGRNSETLFSTAQEACVDIWNANAQGTTGPYINEAFSSENGKSCWGTEQTIYGPQGRVIGWVTITNRPDDTPCPTYNGGALTDSQPLQQPANCQCPSGTKWWPGEGCRSTGNCTAGNDAWGQSLTGGFFFKDISSMACVSGCEVQSKAGEYHIAKGGIYAKATETGWACRSDVTTPTGPQGKDVPDTSKLNNHKPPSCAGADNVVTLSSGSVVCVPGDTPSTTKPIIEKKKQTDTYPDDSKKVTETEKTTDPNTGASTVVVKVTSTGGESGPAGTSTSTSSDSGTDTNGDGAGDRESDCDPSLNFCGGPGTTGLYTKKDKTFQSVLQEFKDGANNSPVVQAANNYLTATVPAGACPVWVVTVPVLDVTLNLSQHFCTPEAVNTMNLVGFIILAGVAFVGFKWAIL